jgi:hypothetical protein
LRLLLQLPDGGFRGRSEAREWTSGDTGQAAPPLPRFPATRVAPSHPHMRGRGGTPWGSSASQPPVEFRPYPPVSGWSRLGASSRLQIGRWDRRQCHMPGRPRNPLNASVANFCAAGVISMHQTPPGMVRGVSGVSRGRFLTISTGSQSEWSVRQPPSPEAEPWPSAAKTSLHTGGERFKDGGGA